MRRAACSIALNIAEGYGRESLKNYIQFLKVSRGSLLELETCIQIAINLNYTTVAEINEITVKIEEVIKMLNALIKSLNNKATVVEKEA
jgi:four helix bundle protein